MLRSCRLLICLWMYLFFFLGELRDSMFVVDGGGRESLLDLNVLGCSAIESWGS